MSRIDELIEELCPDGVEYQSLADVTKKVDNIVWSDFENPKPYIDLSSVEISTGKIVSANLVTSLDAPSRARQLVEYRDVLFATTRPTQMRVSLVPSEYTGAVCSTGYCVLRPDETVVLAGWLFHYMRSSNTKRYVENYQQPGNYPSISDRLLKNHRIPVPPLEVQREIVRVLDLFTSLEAELEAELEARRLQYEHYRDQVFNELYDRVEVRSIGEVGSFSRGNGPQKKDLLDSGIHPVIHYGQIYTRYGLIAEDTYSYVDQSVFDRAKRASPGDLIIADTSENDEDLAKAVAWLGSVDIAVSNHTYVFRHDMDPRFVSLFFSSRSFQKQKARFVFGTKVRSISISNIGKITMPIPSLNEQALISSKLLAMHQLCESISDGLPAEIAARRQQYEYYRDKLLTFKEKVG